MVQALLWDACSTLGVIALMILLLPFPWWWLWRRMRRRKQPPFRFTCTECGYSLKGLPRVHRCPECGTPFDHVAEIGQHLDQRRRTLRIDRRPGRSEPGDSADPP